MPPRLCRFLSRILVPPKPHILAINAGPRLSLTIDEIKQKYCLDGDLTELVQELRFNYRNSGHVTIMLDKRAASVSRYVISRNLEMLSNREYEVDEKRLLKYPDQDLGLDESDFKVLRPGGTYSLENKLVITSYSFVPQQDHFSNGDHVLVLSVVTWFHDPDIIPQWRERWHDKGYLWTDTIKSEPLVFTVPREPIIEMCP